MKIIVFQIALVLSLVNISYSQKNRSVINDCVVLSELLSTDYSLIENREQRFSTIQNDQKRVIGILKGYLLVPTPTNVGSYNAEMTRIVTARNEVQNRKVVFDNSIAANSEISLRKGEYTDALNRSINNINNYEFNIFLLELDALATIYTVASNPYMNRIINDFRMKYTAVHDSNPDLYSKGFGAVSLQKGILGVGGGALTFTEAIDGLSRFIVKRLKEELANEVFQRVQAQLRTTNFDELRVILPKTSNYLLTIQPDQYASLANTLREKVDSDLEDLLDNLPSLTSTPRVAALIASTPELQFIFQGLSLIKDLKSTDNAFDVIYAIENSALVQTWSATGNPVQRDICSGIRLTSLLLHSLSIENAGQASLVQSQQWLNVSKNISFYQMFFGLLLQQDANYYLITFSSGSSFNSLLLSLAPTVNAASASVNGLQVKNVGTAVERLLKKYESFSDQLNEIRKINRQGNKIGADTLVSMLNSSVDVIEQAGFLADDIYLALSSTPIPNSFRINFSAYINHSRATIRFYNQLLKKSYLEALNEAWGYLVSTSGNPISPAVTQQVTQIIEFLVATRKAETPEQFEEAIENFVLPTGSSSIKRKSQYNISVNTYPGMFLSVETLTGVRTNRTDTLRAFNSSFFVPVGISASKGTRKEGVISIFASVIDIGAFTSIRFKDNESDLPEVSFKNIFAPGIHIMYGFPRTPLTIGVGIQNGPSLRKINIKTNNTIESVEKSSFRFGVTLTFDIPIFNIYTRTR